MPCRLQCRFFAVAGAFLLLVMTLKAQSANISIGKATVGPVVVRGDVELGPFHEGIAAATTKDGSGYINSAGEFVIEPKYAGTGSFHNGLAPAGIAGRAGSDSIGYINHEGSLVIAPRYFEAGLFAEGVAAVRVLLSSHKAASEVGKMGYIDTTGAEVIKPAYDRAHNFSEGLAAVATSGKWGYIDHSGKWVITPRYEVAGDFNSGVAYVSKGRGQSQIIDRSGRAVIRTGGVVLEIKDAIREGLVPVKMISKEHPEGKWGYANIAGRIVIDGQFDNAGAFSEGLAAAWRGGKVGFIDHSGKFVIQPMYDDVTPDDGTAHIDGNAKGAFHEGAAVVEVKGKYGLIDTHGRFLLLPSYDWINVPSEGFIVAENNEKTEIYTLSACTKGMTCKVNHISDVGSK